MANRKFYWLKLQKDFFKRHDVKIIEAMENGKDYLLFYLKLLCESVDHEGNLRFSETIPYDDKMLATITGTNVDIVRSAIKVFTGLQMIDVLDDKTIFMAEVSKMIGCEGASAERMRRLRASQCDTLVLKSDVEIEKEIDIELDIEKELESNTRTRTHERFVKPTLDEVKAYCAERKNNIDPSRFIDYYEANGWKVGKNPMKDWKAAMRMWEGKDKEKQSTPHKTVFDVV